jgi:hypothetical protein
MNIYIYIYMTEEINTFHKRQNQKGILDLFNR